MSDVPAAAATVQAAMAMDDQLRARAVRLVDMMLDEAEKMLRTGTPAVKMNLMRTALPAAMKALGQEDRTDENAQLREDVRELAAEFRARVGGRTEVAVSDAPPVDEAPKKPRARKKPDGT
jgi:hypothetical protein